MAVQQNSALVHTLRNAAGDVVFYIRGQRQFTRTRVIPSNVITPARTSVRNNLKATALAWQSTLTQAQRASWREAARTAPQNPQRNNRGQRSGWQYFHQVNLVMASLGIGMLTDPPSIAAPDPVTSFTVDTLDATTQTLKLAYTGAAGPDTHLLVYASGNVPAGWSSPNGITRLIATFPPGTPSPIDVSTSWTNRYGTLNGASRVIFQIATTNANDGHLTPRTKASAVATGTADAMNLISQQVLTAAANKVTFASIPQSYKHLLLITTARADDASLFVDVGLQLNADTAANYDRIWGDFSGGATSQGGDSAVNSAKMISVNAANADANIPSIGTITIPDYTLTTFNKQLISDHGRLETLGTDGTYNRGVVYGGWRSTAAITQIDIIDTAGGNFVAGSSFTLYGLQ